MSREAFEKFWEQVKQPLHQMGTVSEIYKNNLTSKSTANEIYDAGYQTCEAEQSKRIAELEDAIDEQKGAIRGLNMCIGGEDSLTTNNLRACDTFLDNEKCLLEVIAELQEQNAELVEALRIGSTINYNGYSQAKTVEIMREALASCLTKLKNV